MRAAKVKLCDSGFFRSAATIEPAWMVTARLDVQESEKRSYPNGPGAILMGRSFVPYRLDFWLRRGGRFVDGGSGHAST